MPNLYTLIQTIGVASISAFIYWLYIFLHEEFLLMNEKELKENTKEEEETVEPMKEVKYEDKYLDKFNKMKNEYSFQEEHLKIKDKKINELLVELSNKNLYECELREMEEINKSAHEFMLQHFLSRLKDSYIIENTPIGNVAMRFNNEKESFEYYSDKNIPYRFLETVARKYVTTFHCKPLYVIMDTEIELARQKMKEEKEKGELIKNSNPKQKTKDIFANFKNSKSIQTQTNKMTNKANTKPMPNQTSINTGSEILKENANRYTHLGKFSNFILLKVVDKSNYDKNLKLSYSDYIKMNKTKK